MKRFLLIILILFIAKTGLAQKDKDTSVYNLPVVNGKLVYTATINVSAHDSAKLDSNAKKWVISYFKYHEADTLSKDKDTTTTSVLSCAALEERIKPGLINIPFYITMTIKVNCKSNHYIYRIFDIYFRAQSRAVSAIGFQRDPSYLIALYKQKHIGFVNSMSIDKKMIREYLCKTNTAVLDCIASLNKAMAN